MRASEGVFEGSMLRSSGLGSVAASGSLPYAWSR